jgi:cell wall-associated NlpC family hydrolase
MSISESYRRAIILKNALWSVRNEPRIHYPAGDIRTQPLPLGKTLPVTIDCSQWFRWIYRISGAHDPAGLHYVTSHGYTGDLLNHMVEVPGHKLKHGDAVIYVPPSTGHHVAMYIGKGMLVSHGQERGPFKIGMLEEHLAQANGGHGHTKCLTLPQWAR